MSTETAFMLASGNYSDLSAPESSAIRIKDADRVLLRTEQRDLMGADGHAWTFTAGTEPLAERIEPLPAAAANRLFLARYAALRPCGNE